MALDETSNATQFSVELIRSHESPRMRATEPRPYGILKLQFFAAPRAEVAAHPAALGRNE